MDNLSFQIKFNSFFFIKAIILSLILLCWGCTQKKEEENLSEKSPEFPQGIWQLDYYPDSILFHKSINDYSIWSSQYAYNLEFLGDSCQLVGCHEAGWSKIVRIDSSLYRQEGNYDHFWEVFFNSKGKLFLREIYKGDTTGIYPYHKVDKILTIETLEKRIVKEVFTGDYNLVFSDSLQCDSLIHFKENALVKGIDGIGAFSIQAEMDWDFPVDNYFVFRDNENKYLKGYSFKFKGDTLKIMNYQLIYEEGMLSDIKITTPALVLLKID